MMPRDNLQIAMFAPDNIHAVAELTKRCFRSPWSEEIYRRELDNPQSVGFVCTDGERAIGMIHCNFVLDELTLNTLCVDAEYRRRGIAKRLWQAVLDMMQGVCTVCYLEVRERNLPARTLYESLGFKQNGYRPRYYSDPEEAAVLMMRNLRVEREA